MQSFKIRNLRVYPFSSAAQLIDYATEHKGILCAVNAEKLENRSPELIRIVNTNIGYCDGAGAVKACHRKGHPEVVKIAGCELWLDIIRRHHADRSFYLVGGRQEVIEATVQKLRAEFPDINISGYRNGFMNEEEQEALIEDIAVKKPDFVFVAMGSPKQEILMGRMSDRHKAVYQGLGGSFDVYVGLTKRAPAVLRSMGCEWAWRFICEPTRLRRSMPLVKFALHLWTGRI